MRGAAPSPPPPQTTRQRLNRGGHRYSFPLAGSRNQLRSFTGAARIVTVDMFKPVLSFACCSRGHTYHPRADFVSCACRSLEFGIATVLAAAARLNAHTLDSPDNVDAHSCAAVLSVRVGLSTGQLTAT